MKAQFLRASTLIAFVLSLHSFGATQTQAPASDPQALVLAAQSIAALTGRTSVVDATLAGNLTSIADSNMETRTATFFLAKGTTEI